MAERIVLLNGDRQGAEYRLQTGPYTIGSSEQSSIPIDGEGVADQHAVLERNGESWSVRPADRSPVLVEGEKTSGRELAHGEVIECGSAQLRFVANWVTLNHIPYADIDLDNAEELTSEINQRGKRALRYMARVVRGQPEACYALLIGLLARGHVLMGGRPGMGKSLLVEALAAVCGLPTARVQASPDMLRSDLVGEEVLMENGTRLDFEAGPLLTEIVYLDSLHRAPARVIATISEAIRTRVVRVGKQKPEVPDPFFVAASYDEAETPHADSSFLAGADAERFMLCLHLRFPGMDDEQRIVEETTGARVQEIKRILEPDFVRQAQSLIQQLKVTERVALYATSLVRASRPADNDAPDFIQQHVKAGGAVNAARVVVMAAKAHAVLQGRTEVSCDDVAAFAVPVLRHRMIVKASARDEGITPGSLVERLVEVVAKPARLDPSR